MKRILLLTMFLSISAWSWVAAQRSTPTAADATKLKLTANFTTVTLTNTTGTVGQAGVKYTISGIFQDPSSTFTRAGVTSQMHYLDGACKMYQIESLTTNGLNGLNLVIVPLGSTSAELGSPSSTPGIIFDPTPNLILPQWVFGISDKLQNCLLSHLANMLDAKVGSIPSASMAIKTANYTALSGDDTILFDVSSAPTGLTLTLPAANTVSGKTFKIGKVDETANLLTFSPALRISPTVSLNSLNYPRTFFIQSDGTTWWIVNQL